ncbi:hypothetical protein BJ322DRAFT_1206600 [Thelephora terrestris]|uniref:RRM domain-containing protein n=1 Tax=Thelephora terrestris TaxID=56493 RepID=A0A9P6H4Q6_9AGAM|nr:hypothetical protein BJ322DRAFT_1206600 [Thelephora terrestris]
MSAARPHPEQQPVAAPPTESPIVADETAPAPEEDASETLYIQNLNERIKIPVLKASLRGLFKSYGEVLDVVAHNNLADARSSFVSFESADIAKKAAEGGSRVSVVFKPIQISFARTRSDAVVNKLEPSVLDAHKARRLQHKKDTRYTNPLKQKFKAKRLAAESDVGAAPVARRPAILFLQISESVTKDQLNALFSQYPNLHESDIAFVEYLDEGSATVAKDALHNYKLDGENRSR